MKLNTTFDFNNTPSGRVYDKEALSKAFNDYVNKYNGKTMLGEMSHGSYQNGLSLSEVSHKINAITNNDGTISIEAELLDTPMGKIVQHMIDAGTPISINPRMFVHTDEEGKTVIDEITSWDFVGYN